MSVCWQVDLSKMELDKQTMKLVPKGRKGAKANKSTTDADDSDDMQALRNKQMEVNLNPQP
jgi:hypothetical protein